jgi:hypothetical protein
VGILVPYDDPGMKAAFSSGEPGAAASPYVAAMKRLGIPILPHIINAMVLLSAFSAGNSFLYSASRSLYGLALDGKAVDSGQAGLEPEPFIEPVCRRTIRPRREIDRSGARLSGDAQGFPREQRGNAPAARLAV